VESRFCVCPWYIVSCAVRYIKKTLLTGYLGISEFIVPLDLASPREIVVTRGIINLLLPSYYSISV
jgi:hypothetical protein